MTSIGSNQTRSRTWSGWSDSSATFPTPCTCLHSTGIAWKRFSATVTPSVARYLEKIVQVTHEVPQAREPDVLTMVLTILDAMIEGRTVGPMKQADWTNVFTFIIRPLLETPRQARRYLESLRLTLDSVGDEVALVDVLGLEAIRVMRPDFFAALKKCANDLGFQPTAPTAYQNANNTAQTTPLDRCLELDRELTEQVSKYLFPMTQRYLGNVHYGPEFATRWRRERRVVDTSVFRFYLERRLPDGVLSAHVVDRVIDTMGNPDAVRTRTDIMSGSEIYDLISRVADAAPEIPVDLDAPPEDDPAAQGLPVLLDCYRRLPEQGQTFFDFGPAVLLGRLVYRMLDRITDEAIRAQVATIAFHRCQTLSAAHIVLMIAGSRPNVGSDFLQPADETALRDELVRKIIATALDALAAEPDLLQLAELLSKTTDGTVRLTEATDDDHFAVRLLRSASHDIRSYPLGGAAITSKRALMWKELVLLFGGEDRLSRRVAELVARAADGWRLTPDDIEVVELAGRYATGWRPDHFLEQLTGAAESSSPAGDADHQP